GMRPGMLCCAPPRESRPDSLWFLPWDSPTTRLPNLCTVPAANRGSFVRVTSGKQFLIVDTVSGARAVNRLPRGIKKPGRDEFIHDAIRRPKSGSPATGLGAGQSPGAAT